MELSELNRERIVEAISKAKNLPSVPNLVLELDRELAVAEPDINRISELIQQDLSLSARLLSVANSAFFRGATQTTSLRQALMRLGFLEARRMVVATALIENYRGFGGRSPELFWGHSLAVGLTTRTIARFSSNKLPDDVVESAFSVGLLHDLGVMALLHLFSEEYEQLLHKIEQEGGTSIDVEYECWGIDHGEVGEMLARRWELPESVCQGIRYHHQPWLASQNEQALVRLVHLANFVCNNQGYGRRESGFPDAFDHSSWQELGLEIEQVPEIITEVCKEGQRSRVFMDAFGSCQLACTSSASSPIQNTVAKRTRSCFRNLYHLRDIGLAPISHKFHSHLETSFHLKHAVFKTFQEKPFLLSNWDGGSCRAWRFLPSFGTTAQFCEI